VGYNREEFAEIVERGLDASPTHQVLIEESVLGWKEFEMEVVRDKADNCIIICSIENVDPMGVHTGDSITIAPALTLTDKEYQIMRDASIAVLREIGVETGGSNVQFAVNPEDGRLLIIEMNPRVSRSSALASKATGFPIAKVAAKLAVGYTLDEVANDITGGATPASFEPTIDYVVTKIPRFAFEKFPGAEPVLTTSMKSVGEAMAIGRTFQESLQKALRSLETGLTGLDEITLDGLGQGDDKNAIRAALGSPTQDGLLKVAQAMRLGFSDAEIHSACKVDPWFLAQVRGIVDTEPEIRSKGLPKTAGAFRRLKAMGFSDARLGKLSGHSADEATKKRRALDVRPLFKRIDTCAAEFASPTAYMYSTYETPFAGVAANEAAPSDKKKVELRHPQSGIATSLKAARASAEATGYPVVIRPSYVLGGRAMEIVHDAPQLDRYLVRLTGDLDRPSELVVSAKRPLLIDRYLTDAIEVDVDCICDGKDTFIAGIMEHIEEAGIHSGDSACSLPPYSLNGKMIAELERQTRVLALALNVGGLMNVQYAIKDGDIYILEVNPRASRTVPFVAKVVGLPVAKIAARVMAGETLASFKLKPLSFDLKTSRHVGVKEAVFPFARFGDKVDTVLGPEVKSTGEVMGRDRHYAVAFAESQR